MPKDHWSRENRKIASRKASKSRKLATTYTISPGSPLKIRLAGSDDIFRDHKSKTEIQFSTCIAENERAMLFEHGGYEIWVSRYTAIKS